MVSIIPYGKYVKQTSSQESLDGLEPYLAEMFLTRSWSSFVTFCSDRSSNMAASAHKSLWLAEISTINQNLVRNISTKYGSNTSSGSWEVCFTYFPYGHYVKLCPPLAVILDLNASDWLNFLMIFSDTTWRIELKIVMNDHYKLLTKCCYFLDRLKIQDGHQQGT
jgi:hypothetical protein